MSQISCSCYSQGLTAMHSLKDVALTAGQGTTVLLLFVPAVSSTCTDHYIDSNDLWVAKIKTDKKNHHLFFKSQLQTNFADPWLISNRYQSISLQVHTAIFQ